MPLCPKCGVWFHRDESACPGCSDSVERKKPPTDLQKTMHVALMSLGVWIVGTGIVGFLSVFFVTLCDYDMLHPGWATIALVVYSCTGLLIARTDTEDIQPIHIAIGSAIPSLIGWIVYLGFSMHDTILDPDNLAGVCWLCSVIPAAGVVGMLRGVRSRKAARPFASLFCCAVMISACSMGSWWLSRTSFPQLFQPASGAIRYTPPRHSQDLIEPNSLNDRHTARPAR